MAPLHDRRLRRDVQDRGLEDGRRLQCDVVGVLGVLLVEEPRTRIVRVVVELLGK